jgi:hypothetical protein
MTDTPKFTVVDRRKFRAEEESSPSTESKPIAPTPKAEETPVKAGPAPAPTAGPRLTLVEPPAPPVAVAEEEDFSQDPQLPPAPKKLAYDQSAERIDNLVRAQNPGAPAPEKIGFEHLVQQLYLSAMMQMGAGTPEGQRPRVDILGARQTIDLLGVVQEKTKGNLTPQEARTIDTVLYELHMTFLELTRMISTQPPMPPPPGGAKR